MEKIYIYSSTNYNADAKTFNTIEDVAKFKQANIQKPKEWAVNRLNMDGKILGIL